MVTEQTIRNTYATEITDKDKHNIHKPKIWSVWPTLTTAKAYSHAKRAKNSFFLKSLLHKIGAGEKKASYVRATVYTKASTKHSP